ncbi:hypothetical protein BGZ76_000571 [Entomortierella beljakovae]|nr:hypothetical protein BGZ76_000571 [Entomortierella beljakovae]
MNVEVTVKNGSKYEGIFHTAFTEGELGIVLRLAKSISGKDKNETPTMKQQLIIQPKDCVAINVIGVDFVPSEKSGHDRGEREGFKTDTDISRSGDIRERDLKKWAPEEYSSVGGIEDNLEDTQFNGKAGWDQFAANERLFGVRTDFDEELYTTKLDRSGADFKAREQQAIQIANEIQQSVSNNVHMREERGLSVDDSGLDEEDLYGAVVREQAPASNKYMPPAMRRQQELNQQKRALASSQQQQRPPNATSQSPIVVQTNIQAVTHGEKSAPISSSSSQPAQPAQPAQQNNAQKPVPTEKAPVPAQAPTTGAVPVANKTTERASISRSGSTKGSNPQFNLSELRKSPHSAIQSIMTPDTIKGSKNQTIPDHAMDSKQIEDKFTADLNDFTANDKARVKETKMELSQLKRERDIERFKKFGEEVSKMLLTPVPDDVMQILGKKSSGSSTDDKTPEATATYDASAKEKVNENNDKKPEVSKAVTADVPTIVAPVPLEKPAAIEKAPEKTAVANSFKFNVKASVFKPNVNAAPFTPSFGGDKKTSTFGAADKNLFFGKIIKKGQVPLKEFMPNPFKKNPAVVPSTVIPTWNYGEMTFRNMFQPNRYEDNLMYAQSIGQHDGSGGNAYYPMNPYNYAHNQFAVPPSMAMAAPSHMVPFPGPVPFAQPPPPGMTHTGVAPGFAQIPPTSTSHYAQGFQPPRSGMIPQHMPMYPYSNAHGTHMMVPMIPPAPGNMMMHQRPLGVDQQMMHFQPVGRKSGSNEDIPLDTTSSN